MQLTVQPVVAPPHWLGPSPHAPQPGAGVDICPPVPPSPPQLPWHVQASQHTPPAHEKPAAHCDESVHGAPHVPAEAPQSRQLPPSPASHVPLSTHRQSEEQMSVFSPGSHTPLPHSAGSLVMPVPPPVVPPSATGGRVAVGSSVGAALASPGPSRIEPSVSGARAASGWHGATVPSSATSPPAP